MSESESESEGVMSTSNRSEDHQKQEVAELGKTLKEGERILAPTRRPDGTLRKPIRIRAGYVPQEEVAIYHPKPALVRIPPSQPLSLPQVSIFRSIVNLNPQSHVALALVFILHLYSN